MRVSTFRSNRPSQNRSSASWTGSSSFPAWSSTLLRKVTLLDCLICNRASGSLAAYHPNRRRRWIFESAARRRLKGRSSYRNRLASTSVLCVASLVAINGDRMLTGIAQRSVWLLSATSVFRPSNVFLPYLPSWPAPCIRPAVKSLVSLDSPDCRAPEPRASVFETKSPLSNPLSPCVPVCAVFPAAPGIAASSLSGPRPGPSVSGPDDPDPSCCAIWRDGSRSRASRLQCDPPAI